MKTTFDYKRINWTLILILALFYLIFELLYIIKMDYFLSLQGMSLSLEPLGAYLIDWLLVTVYMTLISIHTSYLLERRVSWSRIVPLHLFFSILISIIIRLVIDLYQVAVGSIQPEQYSVQLFIQGTMHSIDVNYLIYSAMIFIIYAFYYLHQVKVSEKQKAFLETQLLDTRIKMLTNQLQPHFLFNTLNSISSLIDIDKEKAQDTLADLSDFLRQILFYSDSNFVSLKKEIEILEPYLNIIRTRFYGRVEINVEIENNLYQAKIPTLLLQPLIENAVKHGSFSADSGCIIWLKAYRREDQLVIEIKNSGSLRKEQEKSGRKGMGLTNIQNRLENIYGAKGSLVLEQVGEELVCCTVRIPLEEGH